MSDNIQHRDAGTIDKNISINETPISRVSSTRQSRIRLWAAQCNQHHQEYILLAPYISEKNEWENPFRGSHEFPRLSLATNKYDFTLILS